MDVVVLVCFKCTVHTVRQNEGYSTKENARRLYTKIVQTPRLLQNAR